MKRIFISGAIKGKDDELVNNCHRMLKHAAKVRKLGAAVYVPCQNMMMGFSTGGCRREDYLEHDLAWLEVCDALAMVPGWGKSEGVKGELARAIILGIPILHNLEAVKRYLNPPKMGIMPPSIIFSGLTQQVQREIEKNNKTLKGINSPSYEELNLGEYQAKIYRNKKKVSITNPKTGYSLKLTEKELKEMTPILRELTPLLEALI